MGNITFSAAGVPDQSGRAAGLLMLRGPQTAGELRINAERWHRFADISSVEAFWMNCKTAAQKKAARWSCCPAPRRPRAALGPPAVRAGRHQPQAYGGHPAPLDTPLPPPCKPAYKRWRPKWPACKPPCAACATSWAWCLG